MNSPAPKILIVDDDPDIRYGVNIRLRASGFQTVYAEDALGAVATAQKERPDLILLDLGLPCGDGFLVMERLALLPALAAIPVVVLSARDPSPNRERALALGARAFLQKPAVGNELHDTIVRCLPRDVSANYVAATAPGRTDGVVARKKILVVDDDPDIRQGILVRLRASGYEVAFAEDAVSVVTIAQRERPDLVLLDLGLPCGDGFLVMERLSAQPALAGTPVVILSARDPLAARERALEAGAAAFLPKPAGEGELLGAIKDALAGGRIGDA